MQMAQPDLRGQSGHLEPTEQLDRADHLEQMEPMDHADRLDQLVLLV